MNVLEQCQKSHENDEHLKIIEDMDRIKNFLSAPTEKKDDFWESDALIWVDWREFDDSIIKYFNKVLPNEDQIQFECVEIEKERGVDIFLHKNGI